MWRNIYVFLSSQFQLLFTYKTWKAKFHKVFSNIIHVSWKKFKLMYHKFIQDNVYQVLSELTEICERYDKNILVCLFFGSQCR